MKRKNVKNGGNSEKRKIDDSESDEKMDGEEEEATGLFDRVRVIEGEEEEATGLFDRSQSGQTNDYSMQSGQTNDYSTNMVLYIVVLFLLNIILNKLYFLI